MGFLRPVKQHLLGSPGGSDGNKSACNTGYLGLIPGAGRSSEGGHGNPLQYSHLQNPRGQRSLAGYSPWGCKELDTAEWLSPAQQRLLQHKMQVCSDPAVPLKIVCPMETQYPKAHSSVLGSFLCTFVFITEKLEANSMSIQRGMSKQFMVYVKHPLENRFLKSGIRKI